MPTRLGVVSFLNTRPLVHALESGDTAHTFDLQYDVPSRCAERLHKQETDVALIPSIEIARSPDPYFIVPEVSISSKGPVRSVLLLLKKDPSDIRTLALDTSSRTSVALSRIILHKQYGCNPEVFQHAPNAGQMLQQADAALLIGDAALNLDPAAYATLDLGEAWTALTGLPFVYACWTGRRNALTPKETQQLVQAKHIGIRNIPTIAEACAASKTHPADFYANYLTQNIRYDLGKPEREALHLFYTYAAELNLIDRIPEISFYPQA